MKRVINEFYVRALCALLLGLALVLFPEQVGDYLVVIVGLIFLVPALCVLIGHVSRPAGQRGRFPVVALGSLLLGLWLVIDPSFFADLLTFVLGLLLVLGGAQQVVSLILARRWTTVPLVFFVVPVLIVVTGLVMLIHPTAARSTAFIILGVACMLYTVSELLDWFKFIRHRPDDTGVQELPSGGADE